MSKTDSLVSIKDILAADNVGEVDDYQRGCMLTGALDSLQLGSFWDILSELGDARFYEVACKGTIIYGVEISASVYVFYVQGKPAFVVFATGKRENNLEVNVISYKATAVIAAVANAYLAKNLLEKKEVLPEVRLTLPTHYGKPVRLGLHVNARSPY